MLLKKRTVLQLPKGASVLGEDYCTLWMSTEHLDVLRLAAYGRSKNAVELSECGIFGIVPPIDGAKALSNWTQNAHWFNTVADAIKFLDTL